jgi:DNA-binding MarR family transcriptional regulator
MTRPELAEVLDRLQAKGLIKAQDHDQDQTRHPAPVWRE